MSKRAMLRFWKLDGGIWSSSINAAKRIAAVHTLGFSVPSVQAFGDLDILLTRGLDEVISFLKNNGARYLVVSPMKKQFADVIRIAPMLATASEKLFANGLSLVLHTHEHEFACDKDGTSQLDFYLSAAPSLMLELDVGWALFAGKDPLKMMTTFKDRLVLLHLKDIQIGAPRNSCFTAIGKGDLPLDDILALSLALPRIDQNGIIVDQDKSEGSLLDDLAFCIKKYDNRT